MSSIISDVKTRKETATTTAALSVPTVTSASTATYLPSATSADIQKPQRSPLIIFGVMDLK